MALQFQRLVWWFVKGRFSYTADENTLIALDGEIRTLLGRTPNEKLLTRLNKLSGGKIAETDYKRLITEFKSIKTDLTRQPAAPKPVVVVSRQSSSDERDDSESESESESDDGDDEGLGALVTTFGKKPPPKQSAAKGTPSRQVRQLTPLEGKSMDWETQYNDAASQANPKSRGSKNIMNHSVNQPAVLSQLPHPVAGGRYVQVRTQASTADDHFRIVLEVDGNGPIKGGVIAAIWGLSHHEKRVNGSFWVYTRVKKDQWVHHSGTAPW